MSATTAASLHEVIDLLSDGDDDDEETTNKKRPCSAINVKTRRVQAKTIQKSDASHDDDDIQIVNGGGTETHLVHANTKNSTNENDDICIVGSTGPNALEDFPHSRESCVKHSFSDDPILFCAQCYCFVCDQEASKCPCWSQHCHATYNQPKWRRMRQEWKLKKKSGGSSVSVPPAVAAPVRPPPPAIQITPNQAYLQRINFLTSYLHGQNAAFRQSGSFTASTRQRNTSTRAARRGQRRPAASRAARPVISRTVAQPPPPPVYQTTSAASQAQCIKDLLDGVAKHSSLPPGSSSLVEPPATQVFRTSLRHDQLESVTFMKHIEQEVITNPSIVTGGWLSDEGDKTATTLALVVSNPMLCPPTTEQVTRFQKIDNTTPKLKVKCTVVLTFDEFAWKRACQMHAPKLCIVTDLNPLHLGRADFASADIIIAPSDSNWHDEIINNFEFYRVIADESQLFAKRHYQTAQYLASQRRWCLSSTPCSTSVFDLLSQITFISPTGRWKYDGELHMALGNFRGGTAAGFQALVQVLVKCMVRHTKSQQRRQRKQQTSQPTLRSRSTISTIYLNMSSAEQASFGYQSSAGSAKRLNGIVENGGTMNEVQRALLCERSESMLASSKIAMLVAELQEARLVDPALKAVVYSQYMATHDACVAKLERLGYDVYHVTDSTDNCEETIQKFQSDSENPAVLIVQLGESTHGFKPPTAKRVYLMEPFLDPAFQAKVTGQEGTVVAKRFVYRYSTESNIVELHKQIAAGKVSLANDGSFLPPEAIQILTKGMPRSNTESGARETRLLDV